jgi:hypothetical protein
MQLINAANTAALASEAERSNKRSFDEAFGGEHDYGCSICGGQHAATECSLDGGEALR